jgi:hypothetical protein
MACAALIRSLVIRLDHSANTAMITVRQGHEDHGTA